MPKQKIRLIFETEGGVAWGSLGELFYGQLAPRYPEAKLTISFAAGEENSLTLLEEAEELATLAETAQHETQEDLVAQIRPISTALEHVETKKVTEGGIVLIAVAHSKGVGAFGITHTFPLHVLPAEAQQGILGALKEVRDIMRPRTRSDIDLQAALLSQYITGVFEEVVRKLYGKDEDT